MSEKEIILGCLENDIKSQKALFDNYSNKMKSLCLRYVGNEQDAEDVLQEGFILVFTKLKNYKFDGSFEGWLRKIMINVSLRFLKKKKKMFVENIDDVYSLYDKSENIYAKLSQDDLMQTLYKLPDGYRLVFNMYAIEGYSHKEIGKILKIGESTSRSQLAKAKSRLRVLLMEMNRCRI